MQSPAPSISPMGSDNADHGCPRELVKVKIERSAPRSAKRRLAQARKSLRGATKAARRIAKERNLYAVAVTLTYERCESASPRDISRFLERLRKRLHRIGQRLLYTWVLERSSILHYHLTLWLPQNFKLLPDELWDRGSTWISRCRDVAAWLRYLMKGEDKGSLPRNSNLFGYGGLDQAAQREMRWAALPRWLVERLPFDVMPRRIPRLGWIDVATGDIHRSPLIWSPRGWIQSESRNSPRTA